MKRLRSCTRRLTQRPINLDRASQIEIVERPNETREQRRNSPKGSCRKTRTNIAADRPPNAKKVGDTQNPVSSRGHRPRAQLTHSKTHRHTHTHTDARPRLYLSVQRFSGHNAVAQSPGWAIRRALREVDQLIVPARLRPTSARPTPGRRDQDHLPKGPTSPRNRHFTTHGTKFIYFVAARAQLLSCFGLLSLFGRHSFLFFSRHASPRQHARTHARAAHPRTTDDERRDVRSAGVADWATVEGGGTERTLTA